MSGDSFVSRWGIPELDDERWIKIPGYIIRNWSKFVTVSEWAFIVQVMSYKYDSEKGEAKPSLTSIQKEMGYDQIRTVQRLKSSLIEKGMLTVTWKTGYTDTYHFTGFVKSCKEADGKDSDKNVTPQKTSKKDATKMSDEEMTKMSGGDTTKMTDKEIEFKDSESKNKNLKDSSSLPEEVAPSDIIGEVTESEPVTELVPVADLAPIQEQAELLPSSEQAVAVEESASQLDAQENFGILPAIELDAEIIAQPEPVTVGEIDADPLPEPGEVEAVIAEAESLIGDKSKKTPKPRERDRIFDGVAKISFNIDAKLADDNPDIKQFITKNGPRIGKIVRWLKSLSVTVTPEMLWAFAKWYKTKFGGIDLPRDKDKFEEHFTAYLQTLTEQAKPESRYANAQKPPDESDMEEVDWEAEERKYQENKREREKAKLPA